MTEKPEVTVLSRELKAVEELGKLLLGICDTLEDFEKRLRGLEKAVFKGGAEK